MATVTPFRGLVYNTRHVPDLRLVVAPPYDVISPDKDEELRRRHPHNIVHLILPRPDAGVDRYAHAAALLDTWKKEEILVQDEIPALYVVSQKYQAKGMGERTRFGLVARLRIEDDETRVIRPHEQTMAGPRADRTDLLRSTRTSLSQIFLLYSDPEAAVTGALDTIAARPADRWAVDDAGIESSFWRITEPSLVQQLCAAFAGKTLWIADGHHRYAAARAMRDALRASDGSAPGSRSYDYVMVYMTCMESPGVTILPYHRAVRNRDGLDRAAFVQAAHRLFEVKEFAFEGYEHRAEQIRRRLLEGARRDRNAFAVYTGPGSFLMLLLKEGPSAAALLEAGLAGPLRSLDVSVVHHLLIERCLGITPEEQRDAEGPLRFTSDMDRAMAWVDSGEAQAALLLNATRREHLVAVADAGLQMPQKSTYFYPKVLTGLILNPLDPFEEIHMPAVAAG